MDLMEGIFTCLTVKREVGVALGKEILKCIKNYLNGSQCELTMSLAQHVLCPGSAPNTENVGRVFAVLLRTV